MHLASQLISFCRLRLFPKPHHDAAAGQPTLTAEGSKLAADDGIQHRTLNINGINMHIAEKGEGPVVLFIHGFPELWYSWRHQILALSAAGYHAVAPDMRGYGDTDAPREARGYTYGHVVGGPSGAG
ncbi:hypothetical protein Ancab_013600 [Ancistrocladus abbreviatus]